MSEDEAREHAALLNTINLFGNGLSHEEFQYVKKLAFEGVGVTLPEVAETTDGPILLRPEAVIN